jgi:hypothetical protein
LQGTPLNGVTLFISPLELFAEVLTVILCHSSSMDTFDQFALHNQPWIRSVGRDASRHGVGWDVLRCWNMGKNSAAPILHSTFSWAWYDNSSTSLWSSWWPFTWNTLRDRWSFRSFTVSVIWKYRSKSSQIVRVGDQICNLSKASTHWIIPLLSQ